jgi:hypothetical protein
MTEELSAVCTGVFHIFGIDVHCHVLNNGQRMIEAESLTRLTEAMESPEERELGEIEQFHRWQEGG